LQSDFGSIEIGWRVRYPSYLVAGFGI
jgi:hypothetical protein